MMNNGVVFSVGTQVSLVSSIAFRGEVREVVNDKYVTVLWRWKLFPMLCRIDSLKRFTSELEETNNLLDTVSRTELDYLEIGSRIQFIDSYSLRHNVPSYISSDIWELLRAEFDLVHGKERNVATK